MQTVQIPAYGITFTFEIPVTENDYQPMLDDDTQTCVLVLSNGDILQPLEIVL